MNEKLNINPYTFYDMEKEEDILIKQIYELKELGKDFGQWYQKYEDDGKRDQWQTSKQYIRISNQIDNMMKKIVIEIKKRNNQ